MPKNQDSLNSDLFALLQSRGYSPTLLDTSGKEVPVPDEAEVFQFNFVKNDEDYGTVTLSIDGLHKLVVYFDDKVADSPKERSDAGEENWYTLLKRLKNFARIHQLSFEIRNTDKLRYDMKQREHLKQLDESYHAVSKHKSYNDNIPETKIVIQHSKVMEEGEQRFRHVDKIFIENMLGERILAPTTKPGIAQVYARHLAEGGKPHDIRWQHIGAMVEEYSKMAGFVRATRGNQFNESAQRLVNEGLNHYQKLRECLSKMRGKRGYNTYFESWTPPLMEDEDTVDLSEMFMQSSLDPRIESVMPILGKLSKNLGETKDMEEVIALENWADSIMTQEAKEEEADYGDEYQSDVLKLKQKAQAQEKKKPVDITDLARRLHSAMKKDDEGVAEGSEFGAYYYEQLAQQTFDTNPNLTDENEILNLGYKIAKGELGSRAQGMFRDEDFPSDFVSAYGYLKKQGVAEATLSEMDKSQPSSDRGGESSGNPYAKGGKGTPIKADKAKKDFAKMFQKNIDKSNKEKKDTEEKVKQHQEVKEGQDDLEAILRIIKK